MLQREVSNGAQDYVCPTCGNRLAQDGELLTCPEHGAFFAYGPHLLVRAPSKNVRTQDAPMPWETAGNARAR